MPVSDVRCPLSSLQGELLAAVAADTHHTVTVWEWSTGAVVSRAQAAHATPPGIFGCIFSPDGAAFLTYGPRHLKWWSRAAETTASSSAVVPPALRDQPLDPLPTAPLSRPPAFAPRPALPASEGGADATQPDTLSAAFLGGIARPKAYATGAGCERKPPLFIWSLMHEYIYVCL